MKDCLIRAAKKIKWALWWIANRLLPANIYNQIKFILFGKFFLTSSFGSGFQCIGYRRIWLGKSVHIGNYVRFQAGPIRIESGSHIGHNNFLYGDIQIGRFFMSGPNVCVMAGNHGMEVNGVPMLYQSATSKGIRIGNDVWIGCNAVILDGVHIGDGAVIGAGSIVLHDVDSYAIYAGNPARKVGDRHQQRLRRGNCAQ